MSGEAGRLVHALAWTLVHFVWQGAALWLALAALRLAMRGASAQARYVAACATLAAMALAPVVTASRLLRDGGAVAVSAAPRAGRSDVSSIAPAGRGVEERGGVEAAIRRVREARAAERSRAALARWEARAGAVVTTNATAILGAWALGVLVLSVRLAGGWWLAGRVALGARTPAPPGWEARLAALRARLGVATPVRLAASARVRVPGVIGWLEPVILVPVGAFTGLAPGQLELLLAHELAHVRRHDYLVNVVQSAVETALFFHPAVWRVSAWVREEREHCCDDAAVAVAGAPLAYVRALADLEVLRAAAGVPGAAPALALRADGGQLLRRIARLVERAGAEHRGVGARSATAGSAMADNATDDIAMDRTVIDRTAIDRTARAWLAPLLVGALPLGALAAVLAAGARANAVVWPSPSRAELALAGVPAPRPGVALGPAIDRAAATLLARAGHPGLVVVQDVRTGAVVSLASWAPPGAGPAPGVGASAVPASVWKLTLAAIWWDAGLGDAPSTCAPHLRIGAQHFDGQLGDAPRAIELPRGMLAHSCTTAAARMALRLRDTLGAAGIRAAYARLGFAPGAPGPGRLTTRTAERDTTFWRDRPGARVADPERPTVAPPEGDAGAWAALAVGAAGVRVSPLHLSRLLQAIGNDGVALPATAPGAPGARAAAGAPGVRTMGAETARRLREAMLDVVRTGTAASAAPHLAGTRWSLGGKTGTARTAGRAHDDGWFAGLAFDAAGAPRYTVVVRLDGGGAGGGAPARLAADLTRVLSATD